MKLLPRKKISRSFFGGVTGLLIVLGSSAVIAQTQPATPPLPPLPRLTLTAQDEYVIRENLLTNTSLPRQRSAPDTIGDVVPQNIKLESLPPEIVQKVPKAKAHQFFVKDDDTVVLVSPSDRRVADVIKKKPRINSGLAAYPAAEAVPSLRRQIPQLGSTCLANRRA